MEIRAQSSLHTKHENRIPFLTKQGKYQYVDEDLNVLIAQTFNNASKFTSTGYAVVQNEAKECAVIDGMGRIVQPYVKKEISLSAVGGFTLIMMQEPHEKKMPIWKWEWNIFSKHIKKRANYVKVETRILETGQVLVKDDVPYFDNEYTSYVHELDSTHYIWNNNLYQRLNKRFKKLKSDIDFVLDNHRYIKSQGKIFAIYDVGRGGKAVHANLTGVDRLSVTLSGGTFLLDSINQERFLPIIPKLLKDPQTNQIYAFPQYDKPFPKQIRQATADQRNFLKEVSLIYSINNSPYFILGRFNYDHAVWVYDWLYIDDKGNLLREIDVQDFFIYDQVGNSIWPDKHMVFKSASLPKDWKVGKIRHISHAGADLYIAEIKKGEEKAMWGIWNTKEGSWNLSPDYSNISVLNGEKQIFAVRDSIDECFYLYDNMRKQRIGERGYEHISSDGLVGLNNGQGKEVYYIDIFTGKEYRE
ncbi:hypothetical protein [Sphingobacterium wenxiniae]|uniref:WG containing repeat-containing protein n=1 Tax=Sphingobacterium wenxiniae TaxID=683125 RepID=A0A1I6P1W2_9SPHI|nr:hypothetical protein [Sphingobacterium wenxiniae]SFS34194.1 hypothetical protein SAMN05660206_101237 [Sphingobacterium wenxiniae]